MNKKVFSYWGKNWSAASQEIKIAVGVMVAQSVWMQEEFNKTAYKTPTDFADIFVKEFMSKSKEMQRAILNALGGGNIKKALGLMGKEFVDKLIYGGSPGIVPAIKEGTPDVQDELVNGMLKAADAVAKTSVQFQSAMKPIIDVFKAVIQKIIDLLMESDNTVLQGIGNSMQLVLGLFDKLSIRSISKVKGTAEAIIGITKEASAEIIGKVFDPWADKIEIVMNGVTAYTKKQEDIMLNDWRAFFKEQEMNLWPASFKALQAFWKELPPAQLEVLNKMYADWVSNQKAIVGNTEQATKKITINFDTIASSFVSMVGAISSKAGEIVESLISIGKAIAQALTTGDITALVTSALGIITKTITDSVEKWKSIIDSVKKSFLSGFEAISSMATDLLGPIGDLLSGIGVGITGVGKAIMKRDIAGVISSLADIIDKTVNSFIKLIKSSEGYKNLQDSISKVIQLISNTFGKMFEPLNKIIGQLYDFLEVGGEIPDSLKDFADALKIFIEEVGDKFLKFGEVLANKITPILEKLAPYLEKWGKAIGEFLDKFAEDIDSTLELVSSGLELFLSIVEQVFKFLDKVVYPIYLKIAPVLKKLIDKIIENMDIFEKLGNLIGKILEPVIDATIKIFEKLIEHSDTFSNLINELIYLAEKLNPLWEFLIAHLGDVINFIIDKVIPVLDFFGKVIFGVAKLSIDIWNAVAGGLNKILGVFGIHIPLLNKITGTYEEWKASLSAGTETIKEEDRIRKGAIDSLAGFGGDLKRFKIADKIKDVNLNDFVRGVDLSDYAKRAPYVLPLEKGGLITDELKNAFTHFQKGGEVPAILHEGELVIPKPITDWIKQSVKSGKSGGNYQAGGLVTKSSSNISFERGAVIIRVQNLNTKADTEELVGTVKKAITEATDNVMRRS